MRFSLPGSAGIPRWFLLRAMLFFIAALPWQMALGLDADRWRWSNPLPHGNNVLDMIVTDEIAVQVGDAGSVLVRRSDSHWVPALTRATNYLRGVALFGSRMIVVGERGMILWSDDSREFQPATVPSTADWFEGVAANEQTVVAVGDYGSIYTSTNGLTWSKVPSGTTEWLRGVASGPSGFVAVGENGTILTSVNGTSWSVLSPKVTSQHLNRVRRVGKGVSAQFVIVGNNGVGFWSSTGSSGWTPVNTGRTNSLNDVARNDFGTLLVGDQELLYQASGTSAWDSQILGAETNAPPAWVYISAASTANSFLAAGRTGLLYQGSTTNGATLPDWEPLPDSPHPWLWDVMVQNGIFTAVGDLASILTSLDGIVWAREVVPGTVTNTVLLGVGGDTNRLFAVGNAGAVYVSHAGLMDVTLTNYFGTNLVVTNTQLSTLGLIWTNVSGISTQNLQGVAASGGRYLLSGAQGSLCWSGDGTNWIARSTPTTNFLSGLLPYPGGWLACGANGTLLRSDENALVWSPVALGTTNWLYRLRNVGGQLLLTGQNGALFSSTNGTNWTARSTGTLEWLNDATYAGGAWYVVGTKGTLLCSTNLQSWNRLRLPTIKSLFAAAAWDDQLVLAGIEGLLLRNRTAPILDPVDLLDYSLTVATNTVVTGTNSATELNAYELFLFGGQPDQQFEFHSCTNLGAGDWIARARLELYDSSGSLYLLRTRPVTNTPPGEFYRTELAPGL
ncbi:MAG: hypothetical protein MUC91_05605 [Verrucomicrobia bacterium]|jgi:hypothetical protein|nr:hypothetical protein [Verrucomicrobiota bacterium]